jgi:hypothetical protein
VKRRVIFLTILIGFLSGCGGGGGSSSSSSANEVKGYSTSIDMIPNQEYVVQKGDSIIKGSSDAVVVLKVDRQTGETTATLTKGKAYLQQAD